MWFAVIGPLEVRTDGHAPVAIPGGKERLLLAVLAAAAPGVVDVDRLLDTIWDGAPPPTARKSLQAHVVRLRSALEPGRPKGSTGRYVVRRGRGYALAVDRGDVDALRIGDLAARGRALLASGDPVDAERQLALAVDLWRGEPYADWPDAAFADTERRRLGEVRASATAGLLEARLALGGHAQVVSELERLISDDPLREGWWSLLMLALYRDGRQADALAAGRRVRALLADELGADPGPGLRAIEAAILAQDPTLDLPNQLTGPRTDETVPPPSPGDLSPGALSPGNLSPARCPYLGLLAYQAEDAPLFHGRRRLVASLVSRLIDTPLMVVSGPSGAGKSSVVRAGLVPTLATGAVPGSHTWLPVVITPGRTPVDELASLTGESPPERPVLLVCDQFEELWAPGVEAAERAAFLDAVLGLMDDGIVVRLVAVVRGDHVGRLAEHAAFTDRLGGALVLVPALTEPELRDVVCEPARSVGLSVEPELADAVVADVLGRVGALPLLSTALVGTWERRRGDGLTLAGYLAAGGVEGALNTSAEAAYASLGTDAREQARRLLVRLAGTDDGGALVRRTVPLAELGLDGASGPREVVEVFVARRLLSVDSGHVEVSHEALLTAWPRLARWLEDDAVGRSVRRHLAPAALDWDSSGRAADELYRGTRLGAALDWAAGPDADATPLERQFLDASKARTDADLRDARARNRRTRRLATGLAAVLVVALAAAGLAVRFERNAEARARDAAAATEDATANRLAAVSTTVAAVDLSMLLAAQAVRLSQTPQTEDGLLAALLQHRRAVKVTATGGIPQGARLAAGVLFVGIGEEVVAWSVDSGEPPAPMLDFNDIPASGLAGSPTEPLLAVTGEINGSPFVRTYDRDGNRRLSVTDEALGARPMDVEFTADGRRLRVLTASPGQATDSERWAVVEVDADSGAVRHVTDVPLPDPAADPVVDLDDGGVTALVQPEAGGAAWLMDLDRGTQVPLALAERDAAGLEVTRLATGAAQLWADGAVTLYGPDGAVTQTLEAHREPVRAVTLAPDGTWAVTAGDDRVVVVWDVDPASGHWTQRETLTAHAGDVVDALIDTTGRLLYTVGEDGAAIAWDMSRDGGFGDAYPQLDGRWIANRPAVVTPGTLMVAPTRPVSHTGDPTFPSPDTLSVAATFIHPGTGEVVDEVVVGDTLEVTFGSSVSVSPDRTKVAVTSGYATTVLDARTREVLGRVVLPPAGEPGPDGSTTPEVVWCSGWTPDGSRLLLGAEGPLYSGLGGLVVVDATTYQVERRLEIGSPQSIEASPDGRSLAVALNWPHHEVLVLAADTLEPEHTLPLQGDDNADDLSFSPDGGWLAAAGERGRVHVFDTSTWRAAYPPVRANSDHALQVEWTGDSRTIVSSGADATVSLLDVDRGLRRAAPLPAADTVGLGYTHLVPGIEGDVIALSGERAGRRYPMSPSRWLAEACAVAGRDLTEAEWASYLPGRPWQATCSDLS